MTSLERVPRADLLLASRAERINDELDQSAADGWLVVAGSVQISGISVFTFLFGVGLIASIVYYASVFMTRAVVRNALMSDEDPNDSPSAGFLKGLNVTSLAVALVTFLAAIGLVIWRSFFL